MPDTYHMSIETAEGVKPHGFHLGTDRKVAETFVHERLRQPEVHTVVLYLGPVSPRGLVKIYDFRDLQENQTAAEEEAE